MVEVVVVVVVAVLMGPMEIFLWDEVVVQGKFISSSTLGGANHESRNNDLD